MLGYQQRRNLYGTFTVDTSSDNLTLGDTLINEAEKRIINSHAWAFLQRDFTDTTVALQQFYKLPFNYRKLIGKPTITIGSTTYTPEEAPNTEFWNRLNATSGDNSDIPQYFFLFDNEIGFYPTPSTTGNTITLPYEIMQKDLSRADFTTGTITTATNGSTAIVGTGTSWTTALAGRFIKIEADDTADSGDNEWYEITTVTDATNIVLDRTYGGTTIGSATQSYIIAEDSILPDGYDMLPIYKAVENYYVTNGNFGNADRFKIQYDELLAQLIKDRGTKSSNLVVDGPDRDIKNPNLFIRQ